MRQVSPTANLVYELVQEFLTMFRYRKGERLDEWLRSVRDSQINELQRFVRSIERDKAAVLAGLTLPHNNGIVKGKVNKLKLIKRMGYGRAGLHVIRNTPASFPLIRMLKWKGKVLHSGIHSLGVLSLCS